MFNYLTPDSKFWLAMLGHQTISVGSYIEQQEMVVGDKSSIASSLHTSGAADLKKLAACKMVSIRKDRKENKRIDTVVWMGWQPIPNIRELCYMLADMLDSGSIKISEAKSMPWHHLFNRSVGASDGTERAGVSLIGTIEVCLPAKGVKQTKPYIVVNNNQRATGTGFKALASRSNYTVLYSQEIQSIDKHNNTLVLPVIEKQEERENKIFADWRPVPIDEWNSYHLVNWIIDMLIERYGTPPYNRKVIMESGIKAEGVQALERLQNQPTPCPMEEYKGYVEWLLDHDKFQVTPSNLTSSKIMQIFLIDRVHAKQKKKNSVPKAFNLDR